MILIIFSCSMSAPSTFVDELRVMAVQTEPAEVSPMDQDAKIRFLISDPLEEGADVVYWTCTNLGDGCLEAELYGADLLQWPQYFSRESVFTERSFSIPMGMNGILSSLPDESIPFMGSVLWVLACVPGECSFVNDIKEGVIDTALLSNPTDIISELPFGIAALSFVSLPVSNRPAGERIRNPELIPLFDGLPTQKVEETMDLPFSYDLQSAPTEDSLVYGYATIGGFPEADRSSSQLQEQSGRFVLPWIASQEVGEGELYIILENGERGTGIWFSSASQTQ